MESFRLSVCTNGSVKKLAENEVELVVVFKMSTDIGKCQSVFHLFGWSLEFRI